MMMGLTQRWPKLHKCHQDVTNQSQSLGHCRIRTWTLDGQVSKCLIYLIFKYFEIAVESTTDLLIIYDIIVSFFG